MWLGGGLDGCRVQSSDARVQKVSDSAKVPQTPQAMHGALLGPMHSSVTLDCRCLGCVARGQRPGSTMGPPCSPPSTACTGYRSKQNFQGVRRVSMCHLMCLASLTVVATTLFFLNLRKSVAPISLRLVLNQDFGDANLCFVRPDAHELSEMSRTLLAQDIGDMLKNTQVS